MTLRAFRPFRLLFLCCACAFLSSAHAATSDGIEVTLDIDGRNIHLDVTALADATPTEVWNVLTDFDHMAGFISNLKSCRIIARNGDLLTVEQHGTAGSGPITFSLDSVREIRLKPYESIRSHLVSGDMKQFDGQTTLSEENGKTRLHYHSDAISANWIPPFVGPRVIKSEIREQFTEMLAEVQRRKQATAVSN